MLTEARCKAAKPGERPDGSSKRLMLRDERGLYLQVDQGAEGVIKSWLYRYSVSGKDRTVGLGSYPETNLADARKLADAQRAIRAAGKDPLAEKRAARAELVAPPKLKKRTALLRKLKDVFRRCQSQPVGRVIELINPILSGWVNYFAIGNASECFAFIRDWVEG